MGFTFQYTDIVILALVAGFLILRLRAVLGKRPDGDQGPAAGPRDPFGVNRPRPPADSSGPFGTILPFPGRKASGTGGPQEGHGPVIDVPVEDLPPLQSGPLGPLLQVDPDFDSEHFLAGSRKAFELILEAFAKGDLATLRPLLGDAVYANFEAAVVDRQRRGTRMEADLERFRSIEIISSAVDATIARVVVRFVSEQTVVIRDASGQVIDGEDGHSHVITDDWTFARPVRSHDPNWRLVATSEGA